MKKKTSCILVVLMALIFLYGNIGKADGIPVNNNDEYYSSVATGYVIAFGEYIDAPHVIEMKEDSIFLDGIQCYPEIKRPKAEEGFNKFHDQIRTKYCQLRKIMRYEDTMKKIDEIIKSWSCEAINSPI